MGEKLHKTGHNTWCDNLLNWGAPFCTADLQIHMTNYCRKDKILGRQDHQEESKRKSSLPIERSFRNWVVSSNCVAGSSEYTPATMAGRLSNCCNHKIKKIYFIRIEKSPFSRWRRKSTKSRKRKNPWQISQPHFFHSKHHVHIFSSCRYY